MLLLALALALAVAQPSLQQKPPFAGPPAFAGPPEVKLLPESFASCADDTDSNPAIIFHNGIPRRVGKNKFILTGDIEWTRPVDESHMMSITVFHCKDKTNPDSCQHYYSKNVTHYCAELGKKNQVWTDFVAHIKGLNATCPLAVGRYPLDKFPCGGDALLAKMPLVEGHWKFFARTIQGEKVLSCISEGVDIRRF